MQSCGSSGAEDDGFVEDKFGMVLDYYTGDFASSNTGLITGNTLGTGGNSLYNGNIAAWSSIYNPGTTNEIDYEGEVVGYQYTYDRLNRIRTASFMRQNGSATDNSYDASFTYDRNGNILTLNRWGHEANSQMDQLTYNYPQEGASNRLGSILDGVSDNLYDYDIDNQEAGNYAYDEIGNMITDNQEKINISWNVYGKVDEVRPFKADNPEDQKPHIKYEYDASGNRIMKYVNEKPVYDGDQITGEVTDPTAVRITYYMRDASGNIMSVYTRVHEVLGEGEGYRALLMQSEVPIYGSDRLGVFTDNNAMAMNDFMFDPASFSDITFDIDISRNANSGGATEVLSARNIVETVANGDGTEMEIPMASISKLTYDPAMLGFTADDFTPAMNGQIVDLATLENSEGTLYRAAVRLDAGSDASMPSTVRVYENDGTLLAGGVPSDEGAEIIATLLPGTDQELYVTVYNGQMVFYTPQTSGDVTTLVSEQVAATSGYTYTGELELVKDEENNRIVILGSSFNGTGFIDIEAVALNAGDLVADAAPVKLLNSMLGGWGVSDFRVHTTENKLAVYFYSESTTELLATRNADVYVFKMNEDFMGLDLLEGYNYYSLPGGTEEGSQLEFTGDGKHVLISQGLPERSVIYALNLSTDVAQEITGTAHGALQRAAGGRTLLGVSGTTRVLAISDNLTPSTLGDLSYTQGTAFSSSTVSGAGGEAAQPTERFATRTVGQKRYELKDHLGNVRLTLSDKVTYDASGNPDAEVFSVSNYYPFGMEQYGESMSLGGYRFGFNGKERDADWRWTDTDGDGQNDKLTPGPVYDYGFRIYDPRIAKFLSVDPLTKEYPWYTPYQFAGNTPIEAIDLDGLEEYYFMESIWYSQEISKLDLTTEEGVSRMLELANIATTKFLTDDQAEYLWRKSGGDGVAPPLKAGWKYYDINMKGIKVAGRDKNGNCIELYNSQERVVPLEGFETSNRAPMPKWWEPYGLTGQYGWDHGGKQLFAGTIGIAFSAYGLVYGGLTLTYQVITWASLVNDLDNLGGVLIGDGSEGLSISLLENDKVRIWVQRGKGAISVADLVTSFGFKDMSLNKAIFESAEYTQDGYSVYLDYETFKSIKDNMDEEN